MVGCELVDDITVREWWRRLAEARLTAPDWPEPYGRGYSAVARRGPYVQELAGAGVIAPPAGAVALRLAGPTLLEHGTDAQQRGVPAADAAGRGVVVPAVQRTGRRAPTSRAWRRARCATVTSSSSTARRCGTPAPTSRAAACSWPVPTVDVPKRDGISYFVIDMDQPGILGAAVDAR